MIINSNLSALRICNRLNIINANKSKAMQRLSTGLRINSAADDPAGLAISQKMKAQIRGLAQAQRNIQDGISFVQTIDGSLNQFHEILQRMKELSVQAANGTYTDNERKNIQEEFNQLREQINFSANTTEFNEIKPLNVSDVDKKKFHLQVGPNAGDSFTFDLSDVTASKLGLDKINLSTQQGAKDAQEIIDKAINTISSERGRFGAYQNRLEYMSENAANYEENLTEALSRIEDADMAKEMMELAKNSMLEQINHMLLKQVIAQQENLLQLLK